MESVTDTGDHRECQFVAGQRNRVVFARNITRQACVLPRALAQLSLTFVFLDFYPVFFLSLPFVPCPPYSFVPSPLLSPPSLSLVPLVSLTRCAGVCSSFRRVASLLCSPMTLGAVFFCVLPSVIFRRLACFLFVCWPVLFRASYPSVCLCVTFVGRLVFYAGLLDLFVRLHVLSVRPSVCPSVGLLMCPVRRSVCVRVLSVGTSVHSSVCPSVCPSVGLFVCPVRRSRVCIICAYVCARLLACVCALSCRSFFVFVAALCVWFVCILSLTIVARLECFERNVLFKRDVTANMM